MEINFLLQDLRETVGAYVDDSLVHTETLEEHAKALRALYQKLGQEKFYYNPESACLHNRRSKISGSSCDREESILSRTS